MSRDNGPYRKRLSVASQVLTTLLAITTFAGCDAPPSQPESSKASTQPAPSTRRATSPYDRTAQDAATVSADVRRAIDKYILDANRIAAERDGKVYVTLEAFKRAIVFVPIPKENLDEEPRLISHTRTVTLPQNAVMEKWTDTFALAQELTYRYSYVDILAIEQHLNPPYFTAKVKVLIKSTQRWAYAGKPQGIPDAPNGFIDWKPDQRSGFGGRGSHGHLPAPNLPAGKVVTPSLTIDAISRLALDHLSDRTRRTNEHAVIAQMVYDHVKKRWCMGFADGEDGFPGPESLSLKHGLYGARAQYVFDPRRIIGREPTSKPAPKEQ